MADRANGTSTRVKEERKGKVKQEKDLIPAKGESSRIVKVERTVHTKTSVKRDPEADADEKLETTKIKTKKVVTKEREKKSFDLPGQKHQPPDERDGLRIFYESLYRQKPDSEMAQIWMMEYGMLDHDDAKLVYERSRMKKSGPVTPTKNGGTTGRSSTTNGTAVKKQIVKIDVKKSATTSNGKGGKRRLDSDDSDEEVLPTRKRRG